jgi:ligand-binding sensor domain-containing protein
MLKNYPKYILIILLLNNFVLRAQQYYFKNYSVEHGLPFVQVFCMYQDNKGYLWSGGYGGLSRFDGKEFLNFSPKNGLINHYVNTICEDDSGKIYAGTVEGLSVIKDGKVIVNYDRKDGLKEKYINSLFFVKGNGIYIGTKKGLFCLNNGKFTAIHSFDTLEVKCLQSNGDLLCAGTDNGLFYYNRKNGSIKKQEGLDNAIINCITTCEGDERIYVGTANGFAIIPSAGAKPSNFHIQNGLIDENIRSILCENPSSIWIGSASGLLKFNGSEFSFYNIYKENNSNHIRCILQDDESNVWLGTHSGLYRYRDNSFSGYKEGSIANAVVFQIIRDKQGDLWLGSETGVYKYSQGFFKLFSMKDGLAGNNCVPLFEDSDGTIWIGTNNGISWYKNGAFKNFTHDDGFEIRGPLTVIYQDQQQTIWVGGRDGVAAFKKTNGTYNPTYYHMPGLRQEYGVTALTEDRNGHLWLGTFLEGIYKFENGNFVQQNKQLNITPESFFTLLCDKNNVLYGASLEGLWIYDIKTGKQQLLSQKDGLNSELLYSIMFSRGENILWIGTNQGINKLDVEKLRTTGEIDIKSFGKAEGFDGVECNSYGIWEDKDSTLWFGTVGGVVRYQPNVFKKNNIPPQLYIYSVKVQNVDTTVQNGAILKYSENNLSFYYRGICLTNPEKVKYMKILEGIENKWSEPNAEDYSKYANLPPGKYTFKVKACNNEGVWNQEPIEFKFEIKTPFFKTWWFIFVVIVSSVSLIGLVFRIRLQNIRKKEQAEFEKKVEISKVELKALRAQMNPHFVFNSLNSIQHYILNSKSTEAAKYLNKFAKLIRVILSNSEKAMVTVNEDIESLKLYLELEQMRFDDKFDYSIKIDPSVDGDYDEIPPMLMQPYVENAILHGLNPKETKGHLKIEIFSENNYIVCRIIDDGIGRGKAGEIKRTQPGQQHKSLGMKITSERVRILNDINKSDLSVSVTDLIDKEGKSCGTMVEIYIPILIKTT